MAVQAVHKMRGRERDRIVVEGELLQEEERERVVAR
jgi:hypothetical protein